MIGAIAGDVIGSVFEQYPIKSTRFELFNQHSRFTDDTVLTVAIANAILRDTDYATSLKRFGTNYPHAGYGASFFRWIYSSDMKPYNSWGNGSAMRVSPVGFAFTSIEDVLKEAKKAPKLPIITLKGSKVPRLWLWRFFWPEQGKARRLSKLKSAAGLVII